MDRAGDLPRRGPQTAGQCRLGEHLGHAGSYQMRPDQLAVGVEKQFHEAVAFAGGRSLARGHERIAPHRIGNLPGQRLALGQADRRHLGRSEDARRDDRVIHRIRFDAADMFHAVQRFGRRDVGQRRSGTMSPTA